MACDDYKFFEENTRDRAVAVACFLDGLTGDVSRPTEREAFNRLPKRKSKEKDAYELMSDDPHNRYALSRTRSSGKEQYILERDVQAVMQMLTDTAGYVTPLPEGYVAPMGEYDEQVDAVLYNNDRITEALKKDGYKWVTKYHVRIARTRILLKGRR